MDYFTMLIELQGKRKTTTDYYGVKTAENGFYCDNVIDQTLGNPEKILMFAIQRLGGFKLEDPKPLPTGLEKC